MISAHIYCKIYHLTLIALLHYLIKQKQQCTKYQRFLRISTVKYWSSIWAKSNTATVSPYVACLKWAPFTRTHAQSLTPQLGQEGAVSIMFWSRLYQKFRTNQPLFQFIGAVGVCLVDTFLHDHPYIFLTFNWVELLAVWRSTRRLATANRSRNSIRFTKNFG